MTAAHLAFASLHVLLGHVGASFVHRVRFGRSPLVVYRAARSPHTTWSRLAGGIAIGWATALVASACWPWWSQTWWGVARFSVSPLVAWSVAITGLVVMCGAQMSMGDAFRIGQDEGDGPERLRDGGIHARCRNPIYVGSWTALVGMTLWHPSLVLVAACVGAGVAMHGLVLAEEAFLRQRFGAAFEAYCARTPRYGVRLW